MEMLPILIELKEAMARVETRLTAIEVEMTGLKDTKKTRINYIFSAGIGISMTIAAKLFKLI